MPEYAFKNAQGDEIELFFHMADAPEIGSTIEHEGETLTRLAALGPGKSFVREYAHVSNQLPRVDPKDPYWPHFDEKGRPTFSGLKQIKEFEATNHGGYKWD